MVEQGLLESGVKIRQGAWTCAPLGEILYLRKYSTNFNQIWCEVIQPYGEIGYHA